MPHDKAEASRIAREAIEIVDQSQRRRPTPTAAADRRRGELTQSTLRRSFVTHEAARVAASQAALHDQPTNIPTLEQRALAAVRAFTDATTEEQERRVIEEFWRIVELEDAR